MYNKHYLLPFHKLHFIKCKWNTYSLQALYGKVHSSALIIQVKNRHCKHNSNTLQHKVSIFLQKKIREKSRECHNHKQQPLPDPKRKRKLTNLIKHKPNILGLTCKPSKLFCIAKNLNTRQVIWLATSENVPLDMCTKHYKYTPVQKYCKFYNQERKVSDKNPDIFFSYFCSKHRLWVLVGTASSTFSIKNKKNNVYPCKPKFYYIKVKGGQNYIGVFSWWYGLRESVRRCVFSRLGCFALYVPELKTVHTSNQPNWERNRCK